MSTQLTLFDYGSLADEDIVFVQHHAANIKSRSQRLAEDIVEIGTSLQAVKAKLDHGQFSAWIETEFNMSHSSANNFMNVAARFKDRLQNPNALGFFPLGVLYELAPGAVPDDAIDQAVALQQAGESVTRAVARELADQAKEAAAAGQGDSDPAAVDAAESDVDKSAGDAPAGLTLDDVREAIVYHQTNHARLSHLSHGWLTSRFQVPWETIKALCDQLVELGELEATDLGSLPYKRPASSTYTLPQREVNKLPGYIFQVRTALASSAVPERITVEWLKRQTGLYANNIVPACAALVERGALLQPDAHYYTLPAAEDPLPSPRIFRFADGTTYQVEYIGARQKWHGTFTFEANGEQFTRTCDGTTRLEAYQQSRAAMMAYRTTEAAEQDDELLSMLHASIDWIKNMIKVGSYTSEQISALREAEMAGANRKGLVDFLTFYRVPDRTAESTAPSTIPTVDELANKITSTLCEGARSHEKLRKAVGISLADAAAMLVMKQALDQLYTQGLIEDNLDLDVVRMKWDAWGEFVKAHKQDEPTRTSQDAERILAALAEGEQPEQLTVKQLRERLDMDPSRFYKAYNMLRADKKIEVIKPGGLLKLVPAQTPPPATPVLTAAQADGFSSERAEIVNAALPTYNKLRGALLDLHSAAQRLHEIKGIRSFHAFEKETLQGLDALLQKALDGLARSPARSGLYEHLSELSDHIDEMIETGKPYDE